jgi:hypothetical protein
LQQIPFARRSYLWQPNDKFPGALCMKRDANAAYQFQLATLLKITSLDAQYFVPRARNETAYKNNT